MVGKDEEKEKVGCFVSTLCMLPTVGVGSAPPSASAGVTINDRGIPVLAHVDSLATGQACFAH